MHSHVQICRCIYLLVIFVRQFCVFFFCFCLVQYTMVTGFMSRSIGAHTVTYRVISVVVTSLAYTTLVAPHAVQLSGYVLSNQYSADCLTAYLH